MQIFGQQITWIEILGTVFGIIGVWLTVRKNIWCFPAGLANVGLYAVLFFQSKLYADASLQILYIALLAYGWLQWGKGNSQKEFAVTRINLRLRFNLALICAISTFIIGSVFKYYTDASLPYLDSLLTSMSLLAQWMVAKRKIENWMVWIIADIMYVGMYLYKNLYLTSILYSVFIALAIFGYLEWKKKLSPYKKDG